MQSDFVSLDMSIGLRHHSSTEATESSMRTSKSTAEAGPSTCSDDHPTMELAHDANDVLSVQLSGGLCKLRVADFPVDSNGLAMWPRDGFLPAARRAIPSYKPAKRARTESESDSDSFDEEPKLEWEFLSLEHRRSKKSKAGSSG